MSRTADYTIQGFLYQFNKTLLEIFKASEDSTIKVEGIVEDVEIETALVTTAIQCKYHEASDAYSAGKIYKPLLQMMKHFHEHPEENIRYVLFAHFPSVKKMQEPSVGKIELQAALKSKNTEYKGYVAALQGKVDLDKFLSKFSIEFGPAFEELVSQVCHALKENGFLAGEVDILAYPNAINMIANLSVKHDSNDRITTKQDFLDTLKSIRKTAISRWTMALHSRKQLLEARRKQLKQHLDKNCRLRYFVVDSISLTDYPEGIVLFICDFLDKYHSKPAHISTPLFCLRTSREDLQKIQYRLYTKGILSTDGYIGDRFNESYLFREPISGKTAQGKPQREFLLRLIQWDECGTVLNKRKCDDLFIIGEKYCETLELADVNVEHLAATSLKEVKYVMGVSNIYE